MWESDNENVRLFFESYLRENNISADDARSLREAQVRGGATYKIQSGPYSGLDQSVKVREIIALKGMKTSSDERKYGSRRVGALTTAVEWLRTDADCGSVASW